MELNLTVRDLEPSDLSDLDWSGGSEHAAAVAVALQRSHAGEVVLLTAALPNGRLVAVGGVDFAKSPEFGELWMLSVHETFQSLGIGSWLIAALEDRIRARGLDRGRIAVEHDNPRAAALYRRLGYREVGAEVESWRVSGNRTYVTVCALLERRLTRPEDPVPSG